jgi:hypothetical protein
MAEWGRKEYSKAWPSRTPVWTWTAILLSFVFLAGMLTLEYERSWTAAERLYLSDYLKSGARGKASATAASKYTLLEAVVGKSQRLVMGDEVDVPAMSMGIAEYGFRVNGYGQNKRTSPGCDPYGWPHSFVHLSNGNTLATFQYADGFNRSGRLGRVQPERRGGDGQFRSRQQGGSQHTSL